MNFNINLIIMSSLERRNNWLDIPIASVEKKPESTPKFYDRELVTSWVYNLTFSPDWTEASKIVLRIWLSPDQITEVWKLTEDLLWKCRKDFYSDENYFTKWTSRPGMYLRCDDSSWLLSFDTDLMDPEKFKKVFWAKSARWKNSNIQIYADFLNEIAQAKLKLIPPPKIESIIAQAGK